MTERMTPWERDDLDPAYDYVEDRLPCGCCSCCGCYCDEMCPECGWYYCQCEEEE